jgi:hypothetical protein
MTLTAPVGLVPLSTSFSACVLMSETIPSSFGKSLTEILGTIIQLVEELPPTLPKPPPPAEDEGEAGVGPSSSLNDPFPRFIVIVDRRVVIPKDMYASERHREARRRRLVSFIVTSRLVRKTRSKKENNGRWREKLISWWSSVYHSRFVFSKYASFLSHQPH